MRTPIAIVAVALLLAPAPAPAQSLTAKTTLEQMTTDAAKVIIGTVTTVGTPVSVTNAAGDVGIYTPVTLTVVSVLKGTAGSTITLHIPGGTLSGVTMKAPNERIPAVGERLRVFIVADGPRWRPLNGHHGEIKSLD